METEGRLDKLLGLYIVQEWQELRLQKNGSALQLFTF